MFSNIESYISRYQKVSEYVQNIEQESSTTEALETNSVNSSSVTNFDSANVASESTTSPSSKSPDNLFVPILGQSNGQHMSIVYNSYQPGSTSNNSSGATILDQELSSITGENVVTSDTQETNFAVGGSKVNGNGFFQDDRLVWWYPDQNQPGGALRQAEQGVRQWLADSGAQSNDEIAIVWSQGESDVGDLDPNNPSSTEKYKQATNAVFDYLKNSLGYSNITFYLVPTGRVQTEAAANTSSLNADAIASIEKGVAVIRDAQEQIALGRDDVQLAPDYSDLNMVYEEGQLYGGSYDQDYSRWSQDIWHLGHDGLKVNGSRLAQYIALDKGENNVISFTDSFGNSAESVSIARNGILDLNISANPQEGTISGTDNPDLIVGTLAVDEITGSNGNDVIVASQGIDNLAGGAGRDVFFYDASVYPDLAAHYDRITDFEVGSDRLDVSEPLALAGYSGSDPVADGYIVVNSTGDNSLEIAFDRDGAGSQSASTIAVLENVDATGFENEINSQFIFTPTEF